MSTVDLIAGAFIVVIASWGLWIGAAGTLVLAGFAAGALAGAVLAPLALADGRESSLVLIVAVPVALVAGTLVAGVVGRRTEALRRRLNRSERLRTVDAIGGAVLAAWVAIVAVVLFGAVAAHVDTSDDGVEDSAIVGPPVAPAAVRVVDAAAVRKADRSVVRILSLRCGLGALGSGWVAADGVLVTNAHVVAGADVITVQVRGTGARHVAKAIWFDPVNDVALLRVPPLEGEVTPLPIVRTPRAGTEGAVLGFPGGRHKISAARLGPTTTRNAERLSGGRLGREFPRALGGRLITSFGGGNRGGSSGGPIVDRQGQVLTTTFAGSGGYRGLGVPNSIVRAALRRAGPTVDTGPC